MQIQQNMSKGLYLFQILKTFTTCFQALKPLGTYYSKKMKKFVITLCFYRDLDPDWDFYLDPDPD